MSSFSNVKGDYHFEGRVTMGTLVPPSNSIGDDAVNANDPLGHEKVESLFAIRYAKPNGAAIASATEYVHIARNAYEIVAVEALISGVISTGTDNISIDVKKSVAGAAAVTVLTTPLVLDIGNALFVPEDATLAAAAVGVNNDTISVVVTATGTSTEGLLIQITLKETPAGL